MKKDLYNLNKVLKNLGYFKEAKIISGLIKVAVPIIDILEMPDEIDYEEEESGNLKIKYDEPRKNVIQKGRYSAEEWYGALEGLGTNVILIPFSEEKLQKNSFALYNLAEIFGIKNFNSYDDLKSGTRLFSFESNYKEGNLGKLKENFPTLWSAISKKLNELKIEEEEAVYMFYNEDEVKSPQQALNNFYKSPQYLSHDIGHIEIDFDENYDFKKIIYDFIEELSKCYIKEDEDEDEEDASNIETLYMKLKERGDYIWEEDFDKIIPYFFTVFSQLESDVLYDVFSNCLAGDPKYDRAYSIWYKNYTYVLDPKKENALSAAENNFYTKVEEYVKNKESGPLAQNKGKVILFDN